MSLLYVSFSFIFVGVMCNIIDSVFYGLIFNAPYNEVAILFAEAPYVNLFFGNVVDMLYFPIWSGDLPTWLPIWGGKPFTFFNAIFNVADTAISSISNNAGALGDGAIGLAGSAVDILPGVAGLTAAFEIQRGFIKEPRLELAFKGIPKREFS